MLRSLISLLVFLTMLLVGAVFALRMPQVRDKLPEPALAYLEKHGVLDAIGAGDDAADLVLAVEDFVTDGPAGLVAKGPVAAGPGNAPVLIESVISGYGSYGAGAVPAEITTIRPILGCRMTPPMTGALIGHVTAGESGLALGMSTYSDQHLARAVQEFVDTYRKLGGGADIAIPAPTFQAYDVAVTETGAPVYLVLESTGGNRIWNIHAAPGVRIERVVLLGGDQAGVANLDSVVPVEVILGPGLADCGIVPSYAPSAGRIADADPAEGAQPMDQASLDTALGLADAYDTWFWDTFGIRAGESRIGYDKGTLSLVGPVPVGESPKPAWVSIKGAKLRTTHDQFLDIEGQVATGQDFASRVIAIATRFAFGDLERLRQGGTF